MLDIWRGYLKPSKLETQLYCDAITKENTQRTFGPNCYEIALKKLRGNQK